MPKQITPKIIFTSDNTLSYNVNEYKLALELLYDCYDNEAIKKKINLGHGYYMRFYTKRHERHCDFNIVLYLKNEFIGFQRYGRGDARGNFFLKNTNVNPPLIDEHDIHVTIVTAARKVRDKMNKYYADKDAASKNSEVA